MIVNRRYPGTTPFEKDQKEIFFGREIDIDNLLELIKFEPLILLYSKSGLGKSSLLNAGVQPILESQSNARIINIRFTRYVEGGISPVDNVISKIANISDKRSLLDRIIKNENSLWYHVKRNQLENDEQKKYIFIFDQFEELFSYPEEDIKQFKKQLADLLYVQIPQHFRDELHELMELDPEFIGHKELEKLYQPIDIRVITAIRSDKMSQLNALSDYLPNVLKNYYELNALDRQRAKDAIVNPALADGEFLSDKFSYEDDLLDKILDYLTEKNTKPIETFQLQIICARAEIISMRKKRDKTNLSGTSVKNEDLSDLKNIFGEHYNETIGSIQDKEEQIATRKLLEDKLIVDGNRVSLPDVLVLKEKGINNELINHLVNSRIIRAEPNTVGGLSYELSHDTLVDPILAARKIRVDKEEEERIEAERLNEVWLALEKVEKERKEREKERKRQRQIIVIVSIAAVISIAFGIFGFVNMKKAQDRIVLLFIKDAFSFMSEEKYMDAKEKYEQLLTYSDTTEAIKKQINNCIYLDSLSKIFYSQIELADSLTKKSDIVSLKRTDDLFKAIKLLNYKPGELKLQSRLSIHEFQVNNAIEEQLGIAESMITAGVVDDAQEFIDTLEQKFPDNQLIKNFKMQNNIK